MLSSLIQARKDLKRFNQLSEQEREITFYAEAAADWVHFQAIIEALTQEHGCTINYVTSDSKDPILTTDHEKIRSFFIGDGMVRTWFFETLNTKRMVMTLPDLHVFHLKRSRQHDVHYVYLFHSLVSTHCIYRQHAFDHFDTILCSGPHHMSEIKAQEACYGLNPKNLYAHGYARLENIYQKAQTQPKTKSSGLSHLLIAPSWGDEGLFEKYGVELIEALKKIDIKITLRPHPMSLRRNPKWFKKLERQSRELKKNIVWDTDMASETSLHEADIMISDWSGAALEFAFGLERPVLFIDVPQKINNPQHSDLRLPALERHVRDKIGQVINPQHLSSIHLQVEEMHEHCSQYLDEIRKQRAAYVFNFGESGKIGANLILNKL